MQKKIGWRQLNWRHGIFHIYKIDRHGHFFELCILKCMCVCMVIFPFSKRLVDLCAKKVHFLKISFWISPSSSSSNGIKRMHLFYYLRISNVSEFEFEFFCQFAFIILYSLLNLIWCVRIADTLSLFPSPHHHVDDDCLNHASCSSASYVI